MPIPSILLISSSDPDVAVMALKAGASDYLPKKADAASLALLPGLIEKVLIRQRTETDIISSRNDYKARLPAAAARRKAPAF
ncbi:hypothetical protein GF339_10765 [candidate division KSB3 bacterium]|uniref:Response regulatory domain-containing protein n=1 Tax=candidate division KSB3 bacterium TaxID=2044937 RepID=A0A9D5JW76_9BACT|nr:hypothetical protein [candidate division KSB3 bacterium]MBD3325057.1 hypothetical protein [candidate division KSB3 bacterium]